MEKLHGFLGEYVGIGMAATMLGKPAEHTGVVYDIINGAGLETYKVGGVALVGGPEFIRAASLHFGIKCDSVPPWPKELADLPMENIFSRKGIAEHLGVSVGTVYNLAKRGVIRALDLSEWNMSSLYYYSGNGYEDTPITLNAFDSRIKISKEKEELVIDVWHDYGNSLEAACFGPEPSKAWFLDGGNPAIEVRVHHKE